MNAIVVCQNFNWILYFNVIYKLARNYMEGVPIVIKFNVISVITILLLILTNRSVFWITVCCRINKVIVNCLMNYLIYQLIKILSNTLFLLIHVFPIRLWFLILIFVWIVFNIVLIVNYYKESLLKEIVFNVSKILLLI
jgi:hypothetical protein